MSNETAYELEAMLDSFDGFALLNNLYSLAGLVAWVLGAIALYSMAKRRGIHHAWLSWIPVGNLWILGSLADQYRYVAHGEVKNKRKALLILSLIQVVLTIIMSVVIVMAIFRVLGMTTGSYTEDQMFEMIFGSIMGVLFMILPMMGVGLAVLIIRYMALYDVFRSAVPENAVMFLVLSIFFKITEPFFLFFNRLKDDGMVRQAPKQPQQNYKPPVYVNGTGDGPAWNESQTANQPQQPQETRQNPEGSPEPWTKDPENQDPENQDPWNQGPEQL